MNSGRDDRDLDAIARAIARDGADVVLWRARILARRAVDLHCEAMNASRGPTLAPTGEATQ